MFTLHPQLNKDTHLVGEFTLSLLLLMNDNQYPWCILVPQRPGLREIYELNGAERRQFTEESCTLAMTMQRLFTADKINIAALGNVVPQLHIHHIARYTSDPTWPAPVWGKHPVKPYTADEAAAQLAKLRQTLAGQCGFQSATRIT